MSGQDQIVQIQQAKELMESANKQFRINGTEYAENEKNYRIALAKKILILKEEGYAATLILDLSRGDEAVAELKQKRDISSTLMNSAQMAVYNYRLEYRLLNEQSRQDMMNG